MTEEGFYFANRTRLVILVLSILCLCCPMCNNLSFNITRICMVDTSGNGTSWLSNESNMETMITAVAIGSIVGTFPIIYLVQKIGMKTTLIIYGFVSGISTIIFPIAVSMGFSEALGVRVLQGAATSVGATALSMIPNAWSPIGETATFVAVLSSYFQLCSIITMPVGGWLCSINQWEALYYGQGIFTLVVYIVFCIFYKDDPALHRNVSEKELKTINNQKITSKEVEPVPYLKVSTDLCILSIWLSCFAGCIGVFTLLLYGPKYLNKVLGMDPLSTGGMAALPYIIGAGVKFIAGPLSDAATCMTQRQRILLFAAVSQGVEAFCYFVLTMNIDALLAQISYTAIVVFAGLNIVGVIRCAQIVAAQHCHYVMVIITIITFSTTLIVPMAVTFICPDHTAEQWAQLFLWVAALLIVCNIPFLFFARDQPAPWTKSNKISPEQSKESVASDSSCCAA